MNKQTLYFKTGSYRSLIRKIYPELYLLKKREDRTTFNELILNILPDLNSYINKRLNTAIGNRHFPKNKYQADDFIDQLFVEIYNHFDEIENNSNLYLWLFKKTNHILDEIINEELHENEILTNIDNYSKKEWDALEEKFSVEADGDLVMLEDFIDTTTLKEKSTPLHVLFEDTESDILNKLDKSISEQRIKHHIKLVLNNLPFTIQDVFELYINREFTLEEIADIKNIPISEAQRLLQILKKDIQVSLLDRYCKDD